MNLTVSPQMRVVALVGFLAVLVLAVATLTFGRQHSSSSSSSSTATPSRVAPHHLAHAKRVPTTPVARATTPVAKPAPSAKARPTAAPKVPAVTKLALANGWPGPIARAFTHDRVVVAVLYSSESALDRDALAEAKAGAGQRGVPVVSLDVSAKADSATRKLLHKLGMLDSPATLVLQRPGKLFVQLDGYSDKDTVAQAVASAAFPS
jgi:hypothetical protein